ncbi:MAG: hypothetical protein HY908_19590 [Myxococcales bacterium]|nr:hypothetical protein [Myxococcales bacterium]
MRTTRPGWVAVALFALTACGGRDAAGVAGSASAARLSSTRCGTDADCVISCDREGECCTGGCGCETAVHRSVAEAAAAWRRSHCKGWDEDGCPTYDCDRPRHRYVPVCRAGACVADERPLDE